MSLSYQSFDKSVQDMSMIIVKKRERTQNWAPEEKNILLSLIKPQINAIENKKIDAAASAMKTQAWHQIHNAFRGRFSTDRDITRIKEQWRRMKAQTKSEMITFAERVRIDPEEATKCRPSDLSLEIWRLLESVRKTDCEGDRSDESNEDIGSTSLLNLLDRYTVTPSTSEITEIKQENYSDGYHDADVNPNDVLNKYAEYQRKRNFDENSRDKSQVEKKKIRVDETHQHHDQNKNENVIEDLDEDGLSINSRDPHRELEDASQNSMFMLEAAQKEYKLKVHMLEIEIQRAELQKQAAFNDLKASEVKRELIEAQANDYYNQVRMVGERGSGAGKGGGSGGTIRDAGGSFGKMEAAHEDQYFYNLQKEQIKGLKAHLHDEIAFRQDVIKRHEEQIKIHQDEINRHKQTIDSMKKD